MLGHRNVATTQKYFGVNYTNVPEAVEEIAVSCQLHIINPRLGSLLKKETDETVFRELTLRGYDLSKLRGEETTAEILKLA